jgi:hypothetical protein
LIVARTAAAQGAHLGGQAVLDPLDSGLARPGDQLAGVPAHREPEEVKAVLERHDACLGLVEGQAPRGQPPGHARLDPLGLLPGVAQGDHVVGVDHQRRAAAFRASRIARLVADSGRFLQPMERDIQKAR